MTRRTREKIFYGIALLLSAITAVGALVVNKSDLEVFFFMACAVIAGLTCFDTSMERRARSFTPWVILSLAPLAKTVPSVWYQVNSERGLFEGKWDHGGSLAFGLVVLVATWGLARPSKRLGAALAFDKAIILCSMAAAGIAGASIGYSFEADFGSTRAARIIETSTWTVAGGLLATSVIAAAHATVLSASLTGVLTTAIATAGLLTYSIAGNTVDLGWWAILFAGLAWSAGGFGLASLGERSKRSRASDAVAAVALIAGTAAAIAAISARGDRDVWTPAWILLGLLTLVLFALALYRPNRSSTESAGAGPSAAEISTRPRSDRGAKKDGPQKDRKRLGRSGPSDDDDVNIEEAFALARSNQSALGSLGEGTQPAVSTSARVEPDPVTAAQSTTGPVAAESVTAGPLPVDPLPPQAVVASTDPPASVMATAQPTYRSFSEAAEIPRESVARPAVVAPTPVATPAPAAVAPTPVATPAPAAVPPAQRAQLVDSRPRYPIASHHADPSTGLLSAGGLQHLIMQSFNTPPTSGQLTVMMLTVRNLDEIEARYGRLSSAAVTREVAFRIGELLPDGTGARFARSAYAVVFVGLDEEPAATIQRLALSLKRLRAPVPDSGSTAQIDVVAGMAQCYANEDAASFISRANLALARAVGSVEPTFVAMP